MNEVFNNKDKKSLKIIRISLIMLIFFILDRVLKYLAVNGKIFFVKNSGAAFSFLIPENLFLYFYILVFLIFIFLIWQLIKSLQENNLLSVVGYLLLVIGCASNIIDRIKFGFIVDYVNFYFFYNNLADVMIVAGVGILVIDFLSKKRDN